MRTLGFSQITYPKKVLIGKDTVVAITYNQLVKINKDLNGYKHLLVKDSILKESIKTKDSLISDYNSLIVLKDNKIELLNKKVQLEKSYRESIEKQYKDKRIKSILTTCGVGVTGIILGYLVRMLTF